ncbi:site-specific integrase [Luteolibacter sp. GHJ8]|uniref:Site-specific integrase n=1 Tax=Luteolibacter rhizosphaerae TaxID=2989719 RepID=A0ABT3G5A0_9BACT|nr:site-specific integrase [Luteolibacter rhizosphaerae]MCW1914988.1 site-specific integrase [Luteolibacter rhizosphaerae]
MVPYFAICYFAGLRPDSEARALRFEHIDWKEGHIKVDVTKTNDGPNRYVEIEKPLRAWLRSWMRRKGPIVPDNFAKRRRRLIYGYYTTPGATLADEAKWKQLVPWGHDITRHSYDSYWEAANRGKAGSRERIMSNMGHRDFKTQECTEPGGG